MLGERKPDVLEFNPSWHHNYASLGFWSAPQRETAQAHYPETKPELVALTKALHALANDIEARRAFAPDAAAFAGAWHVEGLQAQLLTAFDVEAIVALGVHPLVAFLARMQIDRERGARARRAPEFSAGPRRPRSTAQRAGRSTRSE